MVPHHTIRQQPNSGSSNSFLKDSLKRLKIIRGQKDRRPRDSERGKSNHLPQLVLGVPFREFTDLPARSQHKWFLTPFLNRNCPSSSELTYKIVASGNARSTERAVSPLKKQCCFHQRCSIVMIQGKSRMR